MSCSATTSDSSKLSACIIEAMFHFRGSSHEGIESIDFHPTIGDISDLGTRGQPIGRMCTAGLDGAVRIWDLLDNTEQCVAQSYRDRISHDYNFNMFVASLKRDVDEVSCYTARWSPCGSLIASTYSDSYALVWTNDAAATARARQGQGDVDIPEGGSEKWKQVFTFRGPTCAVTDVVDVGFTADSTHLVMVCASGALLIYSLSGQQGFPVFTVPEAHSSTCGLALDPLGLLLGTTGTDTKLQFYDMTVLIKHANDAHVDWQLNKNAQSKQSASSSSGVSQAATAHDVIMSGVGGPFFRRSSWSPDGALAAFPYGKVFTTEAAATAVGADGAAPTNNTDGSGGGESPGGANNNKNMAGSGGVQSSVVLMLRHRLRHAAVALTVRDATHLRGCKFAPRVFEPFPEDVKNPDRLKAKGSWGPDLYRYALAVWTSGNIIIFTSDCSARHSSFSDLHYAPINDVAWTPSCRVLAAASEDHTVSLLSLTDTLGQIVAFRTIKERLPDYEVPPLLTAATILTEQMQRCAEKNEAATMTKVSGGATNKKVTAKRRGRPAASATTSGTENTANNNNDGGASTSADKNNTGCSDDAGPQVPPSCAAAAAAATSAALLAHGMDAANQLQQQQQQVAVGTDGAARNATADDFDDL